MITYYSITLACLAFLSTTLDDFTVVLIFFGREYVKTHNVCEPKTRAAFISIIFGQFLAFTIILTVAFGIGIGLRQAIANRYIDLIGFLPIMIGLYKVYEILEEDGYLQQCWNCCCCTSSKTGEPDPAPESEALVTEGGDRNDTILSSMDRDVLSQMVAKAYGSQGIFERKSSGDGHRISADNDSTSVDVNRTPVDGSNDKPHGETDQENSELKPDEISSCRDPILEEVILYGLLFGVDNISIYVSLICNMTDAEIVAVVVVFYSLLAFYLFLALMIITKVTSLQIRHKVCV